MKKYTLINRNLLEQLASRLAALIATNNNKQLRTIGSVNQMYLTSLRMLSELIKSWRVLADQHEHNLKLYRQLNRAAYLPDGHKKGRQQYQGGFGRTTQRARCASDSSLPPLTACDLSIETLQEQREHATAYNDARKLWLEYAAAFDKLRQSLLDNKVRLHKYHSRCLSVLLASTTHDKWQGTMNDYNNEGGMNGNFLNRVYVCDGILKLQHMLRTAYKQSKKFERVSRVMGEQINESYRIKTHDELLRRKQEGIQHRKDRVFSYSSESIPKYRNRWLCVLGNNRDRFSTLCCVNGDRRYATMVRQSAANIHPSVMTIVEGRPEICETVRFMNADVPVLRFTGSTANDAARYVYALGKTGIQEIDKRVQNVDWLHDDRQTPVLVSTVRQRFHERLHYTTPAERTKLQTRQQIACYARKLKRIEYISLLDSKDAGNCWQGTVQFCRQFGIQTPNDWNDTRIRADDLLRKWKEKGWKLDQLFLKAIDTAYNRISKQLASVGGFY